MLVTARFDLRANLDLATPIVVCGGIHLAALRKIGQQREFPIPQVCDLRPPEFHGVVRQDARGHADGDALGPHHQHHRQLRRQEDRLAGSPVVAVDELGQVVIEQGLEGEGRQAAFDIAGSRRRVPGQNAPEVPLPIDEATLVCQHHEGVADGGIPVRMQLHRLTDGVGDLVVSTVVHLPKGVQNPPLHRLQAIAHVGNRAIQN